MAFVCLDANICVWGVKRVCSEGQEEMLDKAQQLLRQLQRSRKDILIPAPVVTELLCPVEDVDRQSVMDRIYLSGRIGVVDARAAAISGAIWNAHRDRWQSYYEPGGDGLRNRFKYDLLILGTAIAHKAECIYTTDEGLLNLIRTCGHNILGHNLRTMSFGSAVQPSLFSPL
jgi:predicted nucleic acid-binding protein